MSPAVPRPPFRVQIVVDPQLEYFRDAMLGVRQYGFASNRLVFADRWLDHELKGNVETLVRRDHVQGVVTALNSARAERHFAGLSVPVVNVSNTALDLKVSRVTQDDEAVGRLAAEHLLACGCRAFGFWGQSNASYSVQRLSGFSGRLATAGHQTRVRLTGADEAKWSSLRLKAWLAGMPRPAGVFAVLDPMALALIRAARELGCRVPEDVAVLGAGDDAFWVEFESVPLSSVRLPGRKIGYEAAVLLDRLIGGGGNPPEVVRLPINEIAARRSTDILHVEDAAVAKAARYIREHATENPYVGDIARAAGVSLSSLQSRFQAKIGRPLVAEIRRVRLARAQELLADTDLPISIVAERCGFTNSQQFSVRFREATGSTPKAYRKRFHGEIVGP